MTWTYQQSAGTLTDPTGNAIGTGYAGRNDGYNNPAMDSVENTGPCPAGDWTIGASFTHPLAGPVTMRLTPVDGTVTYGRAGFMIHGDTVIHATDPHAGNSASEGCIVLARFMREAISASGDTDLVVIA